MFIAAAGLLQDWAGFAIHTYCYSASTRIDITGKEVSSSAIGGVPYREGVFNTWNDPAQFGLFCEARVTMPYAVKWRRSSSATTIVWMLVHEAAQKTGTVAEDISFAGAVKTVLAFSSELRQYTGEQRERLYNHMLDQIAANTNHHPFNRVEPRLIKRETAWFAYLREPRCKAKRKCLS